jgi:hypothetical protein
MVGPIQHVFGDGPAAAFGAAWFEARRVERVGALAVILGLPFHAAHHARPKRDPRLADLRRDGEHRAVADVELAEARLPHHRQRVVVGLHAMEVLDDKRDDLDARIADVIVKLRLELLDCGRVEDAVFVINEAREFRRRRVLVGPGGRHRGYALAAGGRARRRLRRRLGGRRAGLHRRRRRWRDRGSGAPPPRARARRSRPCRPARRPPSSPR